MTRRTRLLALVGAGAVLACAGVVVLEELDLHTAALGLLAALVGGLGGLIMAGRRDEQARDERLHRRLQELRSKVVDELTDALNNTGTNMLHRLEIAIDDAQRETVGRLGDTIADSNAETGANVARHVAETTAGTGQKVARHVADLLTDSNRKTEVRAQQHYQQLASLVDLRALFDVRAPLPPMRGWAASPDLLVEYVATILSTGAAKVVECGSGVSTLWAAYALDKLGRDGHVVALEAEAEYAEKTRRLLEQHGLSHRATVRHAPLQPVRIGSDEFSWYALDAARDLADIDVLLVDGPIGGQQQLARYPAVPLLWPRLAPEAVVLLDDADRTDERTIADRWTTEHPGLALTHLPHEKGTAVLTRTPVSPGRAPQVPAPSNGAENAAKDVV